MKVFIHRPNFKTDGYVSERLQNILLMEVKIFGRISNYVHDVIRKRKRLISGSGSKLALQYCTSSNLLLETQTLKYVKVYFNHYTNLKLGLEQIEDV